MFTIFAFILKSVIYNSVVFPPGKRRSRFACKYHSWKCLVFEKMKMCDAWKTYHLMWCRGSPISVLRRMVQWGLWGAADCSVGTGKRWWALLVALYANSRLSVSQWHVVSPVASLVIIPGIHSSRHASDHLPITLRRMTVLTVRAFRKSTRQRYSPASFTCTGSICKKAGMLCWLK